jgi:glycosyltransferase involved in cell wall biosynthesis
MSVPDPSLPAVIDNAAWADAAPRLSVVMPFLRNDPGPLLTQLEAEAKLTRGAVEIIALDDGGGDEGLTRRTASLMAEMSAPTRLIVLNANEGRARGRNRLVAAARARHILLIDSDMAPDAPDFLRRYLNMAGQDVAAAFGGFTVDRVEASPAQALHRALQMRGECLPAKKRARQPEKYVYTCNLLVRRDVFEAEAFDEGFCGWGWEDVEWGMRVAARFGVLQVDNPAAHLGLDDAAALARKYEQSAANFARVVDLHPEIVAAYPSYRLARMLKRAPLRGIWRTVLKQLALQSRVPLLTRVLAMKAYRAALYAEVV